MALEKLQPLFSSARSFAQGAKKQASKVVPFAKIEVGKLTSKVIPIGVATKSSPTNAFGSTLETAEVKFVQIPEEYMLLNSRGDLNSVPIGSRKLDEQTLPNQARWEIKINGKPTFIAEYIYDPKTGFGTEKFYTSKGNKIIETRTQRAKNSFLVENSNGSSQADSFKWRESSIFLNQVKSQYQQHEVLVSGSHGSNRKAKSPLGGLSIGSPLLLYGAYAALIATATGALFWTTRAQNKVALPPIELPSHEQTFEAANNAVQSIPSLTQQQLQIDSSNLKQSCVVSPKAIACNFIGKQDGNNYGDLNLNLSPANEKGEQFVDSITFQAAQGTEGQLQISRRAQSGRGELEIPVGTLTLSSDSGEKPFGAYTPFAKQFTPGDLRFNLNTRPLGNTQGLTAFRQGGH